MSNIDFSTDIIIVGSGPVGLFTIFEAGMLKMRSHVVDTLDYIGGQCTAMYPEKPIYDIPAHPSILASDLIMQLEKQASAFAPHYHLGQRVEKVRYDNDKKHWLVTTSNHTTIAGKAIIIAAGCGAFGPNRPPIAEIEAYEGTSVYYMVGKKEAFRDKKIVIAGGGDSAADWAIALHDIAAKVSVVHRRDKFRCAPDSAAKLKDLADRGLIELVIPYQLHGLEGNPNDGTLRQVIVSTLQGDTKALDADILLPFFGLKMELGPIAEWGLNLDKNHIAVTPATMQTNKPGIYAIGDIAHYEGKLKLILQGFSEAAVACHNAYHLVYPDQALHFEYSTTKGIGN